MYYFKNITDHYDFLSPLIRNAANKSLRQWVSPYSSFIDWIKMFSPIELQTWYAIRGFGRCPLYPQYPVDKYFVDFGNPVTKIALECDGKEWHTDKDKDNARDKSLSELGWATFRISGSDCFKIEDRYDDLDYLNEYETEDVLSNFYSNTIEGLIKSIAIFYFGHQTYNKYVDEHKLALDCLNKRSSLLTDADVKKLNRIFINRTHNIPINIKYQTLWL